MNVNTEGSIVQYILLKVKKKHVTPSKLLKNTTAFSENANFNSEKLYNKVVCNIYR